MFRESKDLKKEREGERDTSNSPHPAPDFLPVATELRLDGLGARRRHNSAITEPVVFTRVFVVCATPNSVSWRETYLMCRIAVTIPQQWRRTSQVLLDMK